MRITRETSVLLGRANTEPREPPCRAAKIEVYRSISSLCRSANQSFTINLSKLSLLRTVKVIIQTSIAIEHCCREKKTKRLKRDITASGATAKVNEINLDLATAAWSEDTKEICYSEKCLAGAAYRASRTRVGDLRNRDERCVSPRAYRTDSSFTRS